MNTPQMSQFLGDGNVSMRTQQEQMLKQKILLAELERAGISRREFRAQPRQTAQEEEQAEPEEQAEEGGQAEPQGQAERTVQHSKRHRQRGRRLL